MDTPAPAPSQRASVPGIGETCRRAVTATVSTDGRRSTFVFTTGGDARDGMILEPSGLDVTAYERNPVVLWQHGYDFQRGNLPIGKGSNVVRTDNGWSADVTWAPDEFSVAVGEMVKEGYLSAVSIGWRTLDAGWETRDGKEVYVIRRAEMMEFSVVAVPADADALVTARTQDTGALRAEVERLRAEVAALRTSPAEAVADAVATFNATMDAVKADLAADAPPDEPPAAVRAALTEDEIAALAERRVAALLQFADHAFDRAVGRA